MRCATSDGKRALAPHGPRPRELESAKHAKNARTNKGKKIKQMSAFNRSKVQGDLDDLQLTISAPAPVHSLQQAREQRNPFWTRFLTRGEHASPPERKGGRSPHCSRACSSTAPSASGSNCSAGTSPPAGCAHRPWRDRPVQIAARCTRGQHH